MKTVRFGVIGVGGMGQGHCGNIAKIPEAVLSAVCDINPATAAQVGAKFNVPHFDNHAAMLKSGLCDAVIIATPHPERPQIAIDAMQAGLHLLSEKPLTERVSTADKMIRTARRTKVAFAVMFQRRTEPVFKKAAEFARTGALGKVIRTILVSPEYRTQAYYDSAGWRATWLGEGGGVLLNQAPHLIDQFIILGGMPSLVYGRTGTVHHRMEVEDLAEALFTYPDGGTGYLYCSTFETKPGQMIEIFGEKGKLTYRDGRLSICTYATPIREHINSSKGMWESPSFTEQVVEAPGADWGHHAIIRNFARHILFKEPLVSPGEEGLRSLELANAIWLSAHLKRPVKLPLSRKAYDTFLAAMRIKWADRKKVVRAKTETDPQHLKI